MSSIDINIIQRGAAADFNWTAGPGRITSADLGTIGELKTDNSKALNALPTPFARFYIFKEAFRRVLEEKNNPNKPAGYAYQKLVSNCLDVFELLYRKEYHDNIWKSNQKIVIKEWNYDTNLKTLKRQVHILGTAIESYYLDDLNEKRLFFIILEHNSREYLLATSSPFTGFVTPPDMDIHQICSISRKTTGKYFKDILLFENRSEDFKNYMYTALFGNASNIDSRYNELRNYIQSFSSDVDIKSNWNSSSLTPIYSNDNNLVTINGLNIMTSKDEDSINYFSDFIIKLPYKISYSQFHTFQYVNDTNDRNYDYLIPLSEQALSVLGGKNFHAKCQIKNRSVDITLKYDNKEYHKSYCEMQSAMKQGAGTIISLDTAKVLFDLALFPNVLSNKDVENNYFKVLLTTSDENSRKNFQIDNIDLVFYKNVGGKYTLIETANDVSYHNGMRPSVVRSKQDSIIHYGSKFYEIFNTSFDAILATIRIDKMECSFALFPKWNIAQQSTKVFDYAIDLGTSNTYISRKEQGKNLTPQQLTMDKTIVSYLHNREESTQKNAVKCWEDNTPVNFKTAYQTEFLPPFIDGQFYKFPIRTAICLTGVDNSNISLFDNSNIAFFYEKSMPAPNQDISTNIKWSSNENSLRVFIRELLLIIKADILQESGNISKTGVIWFRPLSFNSNELAIYKKIWNEEVKQILNIDSLNQIKCYTESEAPYHYYNAKDEYANIESVAIVDIGGGSTDFVYFQRGQAKIANSVHFGCDTMWGNAFDSMKNSKKNGIFKRYKDNISFTSLKLQELNEGMIKNDKNTTQDIINFWISNDIETNISTKLKNDFAYAFAYHFTATMYYLASMLKAQGLDYPRTITFSGNGSRYIDQYITSDISILTDSIRLIIRKVYGEEVANIQLIMPETRKESTCYGGLYHKEGNNQPTAIVYYGDASSDNCNDVAELKNKFKSGMKDRVLSEIQNMNNIYSEILAFLIQKGIITNLNKPQNVYSLVNTGLSDALSSKFQKQIENKYNDYVQFNDTLFFMPVIDALLNLTNYKE